MKAKERIYIDSEQKKAVKAGDPSAAFLLAGIGQDIPEAAVEKYGLKDGSVPSGSSSSSSSGSKKKSSSKKKKSSSS